MLRFRVAASFFCSTHHWISDHAARTHLAYVVCRLLSHAILNTRISCFSRASGRWDASSAQARPRRDRSTACTTLFGAVQKKQADYHMSAHIRMQQSPSRCNARLRRSHTSPDRWPSPSPGPNPSAHCGGKSPYHGLITVPSIGPPLPAHPTGAAQLPVGVRRKASITSSLCPHSPRSNSWMVALTAASKGPAMRARCASSPGWEQLLMTCHADPPPESST